MPRREEDFTEEELERQEWLRFCRQAMRELVEKSIDKKDKPENKNEEKDAK